MEGYHDFRSDPVRRTPACRQAGTRTMRRTGLTQRVMAISDSAVSLPWAHAGLDAADGVQSQVLLDRQV
jgi:hypothetical protein